jgi:ribosomal protein S18 acetylase RimI-like enzyme
MNIQYLPYKNKHKSEFLSMVHGLYNSDEGEAMSNQKITATTDFLSKNPKNGQILIFTEDETVIGYSILIYYWSNEFGGQIIFVDELYLKDSHRNKNIGTNFLNYLFQKKNEGFKAIFLEVFPSNKRAFDFYTRNGFMKTTGDYLKYSL